MKKKKRPISFLLKQVRKAFGALTIDREDLRQSMKVIQKMAEEVKQGRNFIIFPLKAPEADRATIPWNLGAAALRAQ